MSTLFDAYLATLGGEGSDVNDAMAGRVRDTWPVLKEEVANLPAPHAGPLDDGRFMFAWDTDEHHVEIEFVPASSLFEWFYRNRKTDELAGSEDPVADLSEAVDRLRTVYP